VVQISATPGTPPNQGPKNRTVQKTRRFPKEIHNLRHLGTRLLFKVGPPGGGGWVRPGLGSFFWVFFSPLFFGSPGTPPPWVGPGRTPRGLKKKPAWNLTQDPNKRTPVRNYSPTNRTGVRLIDRVKATKPHCIRWLPTFSVRTMAPAAPAGIVALSSKVDTRAPDPVCSLSPNKHTNSRAAQTVTKASKGE